MPEWLKLLLSGTGGAALLGLIAKVLGWFSPKELSDIKKTESEIRLNDADVRSKEINNELSLAEGFEDLTIQLRVELDRTREIIAKLQTEKDTISKLTKSIKYEYEKRDEQRVKKIKELETENSQHVQTIERLEEQLANTEKVLQEERVTCKEIEDRLTEIINENKKLKEKHGIAE